MNSIQINVAAAQFFREYSFEILFRAETTSNADSSAQVRSFACLHSQTVALPGLAFFSIPRLLWASITIFLLRSGRLRRALRLSGWLWPGGGLLFLFKWKQLAQFIKTLRVQ